MRVWLGARHLGVGRKRASPTGFLDQLQLGRQQALEWGETSRERWGFERPSTHAEWNIRGSTPLDGLTIAAGWNAKRAGLSRGHPDAGGVG
jgi:hypothetical protein